MANLKDGPRPLITTIGDPQLSRLRVDPLYTTEGMKTLQGIEEGRNKMKPVLSQAARQLYSDLHLGAEGTDGFLYSGENFVDMGCGLSQVPLMIFGPQFKGLAPHGSYTGIDIVPVPQDLGPQAQVIPTTDISTIDVAPLPSHAVTVAFDFLSVIPPSARNLDRVFQKVGDIVDHGGGRFLHTLTYPATTTWWSPHISSTNHISAAALQREINKSKEKHGGILLLEGEDMDVAAHAILPDETLQEMYSTSSLCPFFHHLDSFLQRYYYDTARLPFTLSTVFGDMEEIMNQLNTRESIEHALQDASPQYVEAANSRLLVAFSLIQRFRDIGDRLDEVYSTMKMGKKNEQLVYPLGSYYRWAMALGTDIMQTVSFQSVLRHRLEKLGMQPREIITEAIVERDKFSSVLPKDISGSSLGVITRPSALQYADTLYWTLGARMHTRINREPTKIKQHARLVSMAVGI